MEHYVMKPYRLSPEHVIEQFQTDGTVGLTDREAAIRLKKYGLNELPEKKPEGWLLVFLRQFQNPLIYILLIATAIIFFVGPDKIDAFIIGGIVLFNAIIGTIQEGRTRAILQSLRRFIATESLVVRDGKKRLIKDSFLVPGDIILLQGGERVAADARIIEAYGLRVDEAVLTGESRGVRKYVDQLDHDVTLAEQQNMVFKGTYVLSGSGTAVVVATGLTTEIGKIQKTVEEIRADMPLKRELQRLSRWILLFILGVCIFLFVVGWLTGKPSNELLVMLTALFICVVPEGLPVVLTLVLATGVYHMAKRRVLVKHMHAVEALGRTDVIVIDKTGTLTRNEMMVSKVFADTMICTVTGEGYYETGEIYCNDIKMDVIEDENVLMYIGKAALLLNNSEITFLPDIGLFSVTGEPTEAALAVFGKKLGLSEEKLKQEYKKIYEIPFDSQLKFHACFFQRGDKGIVFVNGAPETILQWSKNSEETVRSNLALLLDEGLRVVAFAQKEFELEAMMFEHDDEAAEQNFKIFKDMVHDVQFLGFCGIQDAIRPEVRSVIEQARNAGLKIIMATGDHKKTALYVAKYVGIFRPGDEAIDGFELDQLSNKELDTRCDKITVYARVSPVHKLRIIKHFHKHGDIVAMTGDGINDVPSLVAADLGIAMGRIGAEVAKEAADVILLDDSFVHIIDALKQGRHIFYTLRRVILYFFATNMGELLIVLFAMCAICFHEALPLPITAAQILWLNLITDGFLDVALSMEPVEEGLLTEGWLARKLRLVDKDMLFKVFFTAIPMGIGSLLVFHHYYHINLAYARTMTLITMAIFQWFNAWNCRSERLSLLQVGLFSNMWLVLSTLFVLALQFFMVYSSIMQKIFKTVPLSVHDWFVVFSVASSVLILDELRKFVVRHWSFVPD